MNIQTVEINKIKPAAYNPRQDLRPGDPDYEKLKKSIMEFELVEPLVWNKRTGNLVGGHQRLKILKELGEVDVEVSVIDMSPTKEKALNLALNKIQGAWDMPKLKDLLQELDTGEFDLDITGFDALEIEDLMTQFNIPEVDHKTLAERFILPPFSILDARQGYWQDRKRAWLSLGIQSELGRGDVKGFHNLHDLTRRANQTDMIQRILKVG